jgi:ribosome-associated protein
MKRRASAPRPRVADHARKAAVACARALDAKLGESVLILDLRRRSSFADYIVIATGTSAPHLRALSDEVEDAMDRIKARLHHREGEIGSPWILLDGGSVVVHLFEVAARRHYDLEHLWADAPVVKWAAPVKAPAASGR